MVADADARAQLVENLAALLVEELVREDAAATDQALVGEMWTDAAPSG